jgi:hypothetical protein
MVPLNNHYTGDRAVPAAVVLQQTERARAHGAVVAEHDGDER